MGGGGELGSAVLCLLAFPGEKHPKFPMHCDGTRKLCNLISFITLVVGGQVWIVRLWHPCMTDATVYRMMF